MSSESTIFKFIQNYLSNHKFKVCLSTTLSDDFDQEAGIHQGGFLSTTLFILELIALHTAYLTTLQISCTYM